MGGTCKGSFTEKNKIVDSGSICSAPDTTGSKLKSLIEVPYVVHVKVHVLGSYTEKAKIVDRGSLCSAHESTGSNLQYEPYLFSVVCS